jgi:cytochrome P450 family 135
MSQLPPGPQVPPVVQAVLFHRDPLGVLTRLRARHGPLFTLRFPYKAPLVFTTDRSAIAALLDADPRRAHAGAARRDVLPQASPRSPFGADGEDHAATRGRMDGAFSQERTAALEPEIAALAERHVASWPEGRPFRLLARMRTLATDVFVRLVLAIDDERRATGLVGAVRHLLWKPGNPPLPVPAGGGAGAVFAARRAPIARLLEEEIAERRRAEPRDDLLGAVVAAQPGAPADAIVDELLVVMMAAQEPPAIALTNVVYELARQPGIEPTGAVVAEVLRLRPSAQAVLRQLTEPLTIAGHELPAGTDVAVPSLLAHRDPVAFPRPSEFRPERFDDGVPPGAPYIPFGGGARRCIGQWLAEAEFRAVLPVVAAALRLRPAAPGAERMLVRGTVLVPHRSALVIGR